MYAGGEEETINVDDQSFIYGPVYEVNIEYFPNHSFTELKQLIPRLSMLGVKLIYITPIWECVYYDNNNYFGKSQKYFPFSDWGWAIDCTNPEVIKYFSQLASYYVEEFNIDGWILRLTIMIPG